MKTGLLSDGANIELLSRFACAFMTLTIVCATPLHAKATEFDSQALSSLFDERDASGKPVEHSAKAHDRFTVAENIPMCSLNGMATTCDEKSLPGPSEGTSAEKPKKRSRYDGPEINEYGDMLSAPTKINRLPDESGVVEGAGKKNQSKYDDEIQAYEKESRSKKKRKGNRLGGFCVGSNPAPDCIGD